MTIRAVILSLTIWLLSVSQASAETVILVQGYLANANSWRSSGIVALLHRHGWQDSGHLRIAGPGIFHLGPQSTAPRRVVTVDLPTEAPVALQASLLGRYIVFVQNQRPGERIILVGHSAGGIVARFAMVTNRFVRVSALITIAAPHLGTQYARMGAFVADTPMSLFAPMFGMGTINRSRTLYHDLSPERPGNLLGWLNRQPHPPAQYISVIRVRDIRAPYRGDNLVYGWSQDMNSTPALRGRARTIFSPGTHALRPADGILLSGLLNSLSAPPIRR